LKLHDRPDADVLRFARRYGPLFGDIDRKTIQYLHQDWEDLIETPPQRAAYVVRDHGDEPLASWRYWIRETRGAVECAADLHTGRMVGDDGWTERDYRDFLTNWLTRLLWATVLPCFVWPADGDHEPEVTLTASSALGVLAIQLATLLSRSAGVATCKGCVAIFQPSRRAQLYCEACGRRAAVRDATRRYRERVRGKR
jgi:hypothetical protein